MGLRRFVVERLGRDLLTEVAEAAADHALREAIGFGGAVDGDEYLWRSLTRNAKRDLPDVSHDRALDVCFSLFQTTPLGNRATKLIRDFVVGDGISYSCSNPEVEEIVGEFWDDEVNNLDMRLSDFALELGLYGEWIPEVFVGKTSGIVQLGYIDPFQVKAVEVDKDNPLISDVVRIKRRGFGAKGEAKTVVRARDESGRLSGDVFYFRVNSVSNATRGWPDLLHVADWIDNLEQTLWNVFERSALANAFIWDVTLKGASQADIDNWLRRNGKAPKQGSVRAHNEQVQWNAVAPQLGSLERAAEVDLFREHVAAGIGVPKHWLAASEDVNRATAQEMGAPTIRTLAHRQRYFLQAVHRIIRFVLERAGEAGRLKVDDDGMVPVSDEDGHPKSDAGGSPVMAKPWDLVTLNGPELSPKDMASSGQLLVNVANALAVAEQQGWVGRRPARQAIAAVLALLGVDFDPSMEEVPEGADPNAPGMDESYDVPPEVQAALGEAVAARPAKGRKPLRVAK